MCNPPSRFEDSLLEVFFFLVVWLEPAHFFFSDHPSPGERTVGWAWGEGGGERTNPNMGLFADSAHLAEEEISASLPIFCELN